MAILIIDDDSLLRQTLREMLERLGYQVREAEDGAAGIAELEAEEPLLVITDILMPNKEGIETIHDIRRLHAALPIIAMSGGGVTGDMSFLEYAGKLGADRVLRKPIRLHDLETTVRELVPHATDHGPLRLQS